MHPLEDIELPPHIENDLDDVPPMARWMAGEAFNIIKEHGQWKNAVQGYLAACSFADACAGHVLNALEKSAYRDNTIVVLWGDHGYNLGEKDHFAKSALWEETSRTPLIIYAPGVSRKQSRCKQPVGLVDLYPTLIELCGLPPRDALDGRSLAPLVRNPEQDWPYPALITLPPTVSARTMRSTAGSITTFTTGTAGKNCMTIWLTPTAGRTWRMTRSIRKPKRS